MGMNIFRLTLVVGWCVVFALALIATVELGLAEAVSIFFSDLANPWRAQFNVDLGLHLLLVAAWIVYRSPSLMAGLLFGALAIMAGGIFTFAYLVAVSLKARGDMRKILLGVHA